MASKQIQVWTHGPDSVTPSDEAVPCLARAAWPGAHHIWVEGEFLIRASRHTSGMGSVTGDGHRRGAACA